MGELQSDLSHLQKVDEGCGEVAPKGSSLMLWLLECTARLPIPTSCQSFLLTWTAIKRAGCA